MLCAFRDAQGIHNIKRNFFPNCKQTFLETVEVVARANKKCIISKEILLGHLYILGLPLSICEVYVLSHAAVLKGMARFLGHLLWMELRCFQDPLLLHAL
jgi:hypothetical protein